MSTEAPTFEAYGVGVVYLSACTCLTDEEAELAANAEYPTGISSRWSVAKEPFADGTSNGAQCPDLATHRHILMAC